METFHGPFGAGFGSGSREPDAPTDVIEPEAPKEEPCTCTTPTPASS
jgi:hypothetical protein